MQNQAEINRLKNIVNDLLKEAKAQGASAAEAALSIDDGLSVTARLGDVETIEYHCDQGLGVTVYFGQRKGSASSTDLSPDSIRETVTAACSIARFASADEFAGLPEQAALATEFPDLDLCHPWEINAELAKALAIECEQAARDFHPDISNSEGATVNTHQGISVFGNSLGFIQGYDSTRHSLSCSVLGQRGESMQRDYWYSVARNALDLETASAIGRKAGERTIKRLDARRISTRQCPVLYAPEVAGGLIGAFLGAISGGNLYRKTSFLLDSLGQQVFPEFMRIHEQPLLKNALGSSAYDAEGVTTQTRDIVRNGVVQGYVLSSYSARKLGLKTTGNAGGVHNLQISAGADDFAAMLKRLDTGLLVTELMGQGVNNVTGDYSRGASGYWVERGEIQYPVEEITIAGNLKNMFKNIVAVGNDIDLRGNIRCGSILLEQMSIAGE
ncbi:MAG: metalloprotease PmbA [Methylococcaceae bacterium]|nr:metalloprotease PmbA [Methylococcaceae bacterium]